MSRTPKTQPVRARRLATQDEAADYARCSRYTIRRRIAAGLLTGYRDGPRRILVDLNELDAGLRPIPSALGAVSDRAQSA